VLGAALAMIVIGVIFFFVSPAGLVIGPLVLAAGIVLAILYLIRKPARRGA
jgi:hypothetical protein